MRIKHYAIFKESINSLLKPSAWESLRNNQNDASYFLPYIREDYIAKVDTPAPTGIADAIITRLTKRNISKIFSIGSGISSLEYQLKKFSSLQVIVSDNNDSISRLALFQIFDECLLIDAIKDPLPVNQEYMVIFPRIDTEFEDEPLEELFRKCFTTGVEYICFIPAQLLSLRIIIGEMKVILKSILLRKRRTFCGYSRSKKEFIRLFGKYYVVDEDMLKERRCLFLKRKILTGSG